MCSLSFALGSSLWGALSSYTILNSTSTTKVPLQLRPPKVLRCCVVVDWTLGGPTLCISIRSTLRGCSLSFTLGSVLLAMSCARIITASYKTQICCHAIQPTTSTPTLPTPPTDQQHQHQQHSTSSTYHSFWGNETRGLGSLLADSMLRQCAQAPYFPESELQQIAGTELRFSNV